MPKWAVQPMIFMAGNRSLQLGSEENSSDLHSTV